MSETDSFKKPDSDCTLALFYETTEHQPLATTGLISETTALSPHRWPRNDGLHLTVYMKFNY